MSLDLPVLAECKKAVTQLRDGETHAFFDYIYDIMKANYSCLTLNKESSFHNIILAYIAAAKSLFKGRISSDKELSWGGRADIAIEDDSQVIIIECKYLPAKEWNDEAAEREAEGALEQITDKAYETVLVDGQTEVRRIGIVFSTKGYVMKEEKYSYPTQEVTRMDTVTRSAALSEEKTVTISRGDKRGGSGTQAAPPGAASAPKEPRRSGRSRRGASTQAVTGAAAE